MAARIKEIATKKPKVLMNLNAGQSTPKMSLNAY
jgi:hypothetical protein